MNPKNYHEVKGDLIDLAKLGQFDVIAHGCNCFCTMGSGIAPQMAQLSDCDKYAMEAPFRKGDINKLGNIDVGSIYVNNVRVVSFTKHHFDKGLIGDGMKHVEVVNCYTQYDFGGRKINVDYAAIDLCFKKMNKMFKGKTIGLPQIGAGLAGGDWNKIKGLIQENFTDCKVVVVIYQPKPAYQNI